MKVLIINGPNLNLLGEREPSIYGVTTLNQLIVMLKEYGRELGIIVHDFQSNSEGMLIDYLHGARDQYDGIILNPGAYSHYSYAIRDAIAAIGIPVIEVHISNIYGRESFRSHSVLAPVCLGQISGLGMEGYRLALNYFANNINK